jgi:heterotetrameric sarcosine oxidase gamma subunit
MSAANLPELRCTLAALPTEGMLEFVAFGDSAEALPGWPLQPGEVRRGPAGGPEILHFAPRRWLLPAPDAARCASAAAAAAAGAGTVVEVEGKWTAMKLEGPDATRLLSASLDIAAVLDSRECAAAVLFDCPAVIALGAAEATGAAVMATGAADRYHLYLKASYAADFISAVVRLGAGA